MALLMLPRVVLTHLKAGFRAALRPDPVMIVWWTQPAVPTPVKQCRPSLTTILAGWKLRCAKVAISARRKPLCGRPPPRKDFVAAGDGSGRLRSCVRPWCAAMSTAGPDGLRGSGPKHHGGVYAPKGFPGVPILGSTDRHLAAVPASARSECGERAFLGRKRPAINLAAHHHGPERPSHLVGQRDCRKLLRLAR